MTEVAVKSSELEIKPLPWQTIQIRLEVRRCPNFGGITRLLPYFKESHYECNALVSMLHRNQRFRGGQGVFFKMHKV